MKNNFYGTFSRQYLKTHGKRHPDGGKDYTDEYMARLDGAGAIYAYKPGRRGKTIDTDGTITTVDGTSNPHGQLGVFPPGTKLPRGFVQISKAQAVKGYGPGGVIRYWSQTPFNIDFAMPDGRDPLAHLKPPSKPKRRLSQSRPLTQESLNKGRR